MEWSHTWTRLAIAALLVMISVVVGMIFAIRGVTPSGSKKATFDHFAPAPSIARMVTTGEMGPQDAGIPSTPNGGEAHKV